MTDSRTIVNQRARRAFPWRIDRARFSTPRNVITLVGGTVLGQGLLMIASPVLMRLYTPADFGILSVFASILVILVVIAGLRFEAAIPLPVDDRGAARVLILALGVVAVVAALVLFAVWFGEQFIFHLTDTPLATAYLYLLPLGVLGAGWAQTLSYWALRKQRYPAISQNRIAQSFGQVATQLVAGFAGLGSIGLVFGDVFGRVIGALVFGNILIRRADLAATTIGGLWQAARRYWRFPVVSTPAALMNAGGLEMPLLVLASIHGPEVAGWYAVGLRVTNVPLIMVATAVSQVYTGQSAEAARNDPSRLPRLLVSSIATMAALAVPYVVIVAVLAPIVFPVVFGASWVESGAYVQLLAPLMLTQAIASPTGMTLDVLERQDLHLLREAIRLVIIGGTAFVLISMPMEPATGIILFSLATSLCYLIYVGSSFLAIHAFRRRLASGHAHQG